MLIALRSVCKRIVSVCVECWAERCVNVYSVRVECRAERCVNVLD